MRLNRLEGGTVKVTENNIENRQAFLTIEMESAEMEESLQESYQRLVRKTRVPGFRKGKAPRAVLENYIGKESLLEDTLNILIPKAYRQALEEQELGAYSQPQIEITQNDPLIFKTIVPLPPTIELGDYHGIRVKPPEVVEISEGNISATIERLRHEHAVWEPVERPVDYGDLVTLDIESTVEDKPLIDQKGAQYHIVLESSFPVPGFTEQLRGMKKDEEKEFKLQFPADFSREEMAGKEAQFKVGVSEVKQEILPELNNAFAKGVSPEFKTLKALRRQIAEVLRNEAERKARIEFEDQAMEAVAAVAQVEYPPVLVEIEIERLIDQQLERWRLTRDNLEVYLAQIKKTEAELREELRPLAVTRVTRSLVLGKVAENEKFEVKDSEIDAEIERMTQGETEKKDELIKSLNTPQTRHSIREIMITRKTIERVVEIAKGSSAEVKTGTKKATGTRSRSKVKEDKK